MIKKAKQVSEQKKGVTEEAACPTDLDNARHDEQREVMKVINERGESPFLWKNLQKYHKKPILREGKYWCVTFNQWPYAHTKFNFLLIHREYVTDLSQITPAAAGELIELAGWLVETYQIKGGALCMRFGATDWSAGSVNHLHAQLVVPDLTDPDYQPVRFKIGKDPDKLKSGSG
jgi:diadenosine tetraphosphate (Ap4A) HIT family hydrolase